MDHWRSHIPKNNPPKQYCEWSFEQGDRKWQQDELEHGFELVDDFFWSKTKCVGARISGGGPRGVHEAGGAPQGGGRALDPRGQLVRPPGLFSERIILKYSGKNHISFSRHLENFYFRGIFYCKDNS